MGIPKFARWVSHKYPTMVSKVAPAVVAGLYVDMNGIIHPCCHSEDDPKIAQRTEEEKLDAVCGAVGELVDEVNPTSILYLAMDGVAPRAKMNQQRARRYMSASCAMEATHGIDHFSRDDAAKAEEELRETRGALDYGIFAQPSFDDKHAAMCSPPSSPNTSSPRESPGFDLFGMELASAEAEGADSKAKPFAPHFDSNCISPGTAFMVRCADRLRSWLRQKFVSEQPEDAPWKSRLVILSDTNTPGEGEHKFIDFLRTQFAARSSLMQGGAHVVVGLDADLILLSLSLHHSSVWIMRDTKKSLGSKKKGKESEKAKIVASCDENSAGMGSMEPTTSATDMMSETSSAVGLSPGVSPMKQPRATGSEREHRGEAISFGSPSSGGVPTPKRRFEWFKIAAVGDGLVSELTALAGSEHLTGLKLKLSDCEGGGPRLISDFIAMATLMGNDFVPRLPGSFCGESTMDNMLEVYVREVLPTGVALTNNKDLNTVSLYRIVKAMAEIEVMRFRQQKVREGKLSEREAAAAIQWPPATRNNSIQDHDQFVLPVDRLWREEYYSSTSIPKNEVENACEAYLQGLRFVWQYYSATSKQCAWKWFYPYHHAPLAFDVALYLSNVSEPKPLPVSTSAPSPFIQLMCILPPTSHKLLPAPYAEVMLDPPGQLRDTFPLQWTVDYTAASGKEHLAVPLLPFANLEALEQLDEEIILAHEMDFSEEERTSGENRYYHEVFVAPHSGLEGTLQSLQSESQQEGSPPSFPLLFGKFTIATAGSNDVSVFRFEDTLSEENTKKYKPRMYTSTLGIKNVNVSRGDDLKSRRAASRAAKSGKSHSPAAWSPAGSPGMWGSPGGGGSPGIGSPGGAASNKGTNLPGLTVIVGFSILSWSLFQSLTTGGGSLSGFLTLQFPLVVSVTMCVLLVFNALGMGGFPQWDRTVLQRNSVRETNVDWQCPDCLTINFARNQWCYKCQFPFSPATCRAVYSSRLPSTPPLYEANHGISCEKVRLKDIVR